MSIFENLEAILFPCFHIYMHACINAYIHVPLNLVERFSSRHQENIIGLILITPNLFSNNGIKRRWRGVRLQIQLFFFCQTVQEIESNWNLTLSTKQHLLSSSTCKFGIQIQQNKQEISFQGGKHLSWICTSSKFRRTNSVSQNSKMPWAFSFYPFHLYYYLFGPWIIEPNDFKIIGLSTFFNITVWA